MPAWYSQPIHIPVHEFLLDVRADAEAVDAGRTVNGIYASDLRLTPEQALAYAAALQEGAIQCRAMRAGK
jgi:hypothetical protein